MIRRQPSAKSQLFMKIQILTPETVVFDGEVDSVLLPGKNGEFHIMKNHAAIVSALEYGKVKLFVKDIAPQFSDNFVKENRPESVYAFGIKSGVLEFSDNRGIILAE